jgi:sec-independent protein translocase protein TatB
MDVSWSELLVIGIVALVIIGPKDLPGMFQQFGRFVAKLRAMGRDFSRAMEQAAKESGVKDVADDLRTISNPKAMGLDAMRSAVDKFEKWDPLKPAAGAKPPVPPVAPPPMPPAAPVTALGPKTGPATAALAEKVATQRAAAAETAADLRAARAAPAPTSSPVPASAPAPDLAPMAAPEASAVRRGGRVRKRSGDAE